MHGEKNYPFIKVPSHLDIALPDGVDPLKEDKLGKMNLTFEGLIKRDRIILSYARKFGIPISLALGGGYAQPIELTVTAYANTYRVAKSLFPEA